jgi:hypothetical protein
MCGTTIHLLHGLLIGPFLIAAAYYDWQYALYAVGTLAIVTHAYFFFTGTNANSLYKQKAYKNKTPDYLRPRDSTSTGCNTCRTL